MICMEKYQLDNFGLWSRQLGPEIRTQNDAYPIDPNDGYQGSAFWFLWPNTTFNVLPGGNELSVFAIRPITHDTADFDGHSFSADGKPDPARAAYGANVLGPEDTGLCESVQRGLMSKGYDQGPIILQRCVQVQPDDTVESLGARVFEEEKLALPEAIRRVLDREASHESHDADMP